MKLTADITVNDNVLINFKYGFKSTKKRAERKAKQERKVKKIVTEG